MQMNYSKIFSLLTNDDLPRENVSSNIWKLVCEFFNGIWYSWQPERALDPFSLTQSYKCFKSKLSFLESGHKMFDVFLLCSAARWSEFLIYEDITRKLLSKHISLLRLAWKSHWGQESRHFGFQKDNCLNVYKLLIARV